MASTFTSILRFEKMADGEKNNTWGQILNNNVFELIEDAVSGLSSVALAAGDATLTTNNGAADEARSAMLKFTGVLPANRTVTIPAVTKTYVIWNATTGNYTVTIKTSGGTGITVPQGFIVAVMCDGTDTYQIFNDRAKIGKQAVWVPAKAMEPSVTSGCQSLVVTSISSGKPSVKSLDFDPSSPEYAEFEAAMPPSWNEGTVTFRAYWTTTASDTSGVAWTLQGVAVGDNEAFDATYGTAVTVIDNVQSAANRQLISDESSAITISGSPAAGERASYRVGRDTANGSDTMAADAKLIGIVIYFTTDAGNDA